jgi:hypothetical protein
LLRAERARRDPFIKGASGSAAHDHRQWLRDTLDTMAERLQGRSPPEAGYDLHQWLRDRGLDI